MTVSTSWAVGHVPWDDTGTLAKAELEAVWAVGPASGPLIATGSSSNPRDKWVRVQREAGIPLVVHDLQWAQGNRGRAIARALHKVIAGRQIDLSEYHRLLGIEMVEQKIKLVDHEDFLAALRADVDRKQSELDQAAAVRFERQQTHLTKEEREAMRAENDELWEELFSPQGIRDEANARRRELRARKKRVANMASHTNLVRNTPFLGHNEDNG